MRKLVRKWRRYNAQRTAWKTYMVVVLTSALQDAVKWHWRQHWRLASEPLEDRDVPDGHATLEELVDALVDDATLAELARLRCAGHSMVEVMSLMGLRRVEYNRLMDRLHSLLTGEESEGE